MTRTVGQRSIIAQEKAHTPPSAVETVRAALLQALLIALPILGAGLVVGLVISLFQAVTQIQEQTLTFVPKIVVMIIVVRKSRFSVFAVINSPHYFISIGLRSNVYENPT